MLFFNRKLLILPVAACLLFVAAAAQEMRTFKVDPVHTAIIFKVEVGGLSPFYGQFTDSAGTLKYDGSPESLSIDMTVPVASIDSHNDQRNTHLKSPDFFDAREFPEIRFVSKEVKANDDGTQTLVGDLTMRGQTKEVEATLNSVKTGDSRGDFRCGVDLTLTINRSDFGVNYGIDQGALGDEVTLMIGIQGVAQ